MIEVKFVNFTYQPTGKNDKSVNAKTDTKYK